MSRAVNGFSLEPCCSRQSPKSEGRESLSLEPSSSRQSLTSAWLSWLRRGATSRRRRGPCKSRPWVSGLSVHVRACACVRLCVRACVRARARARVRVCVCAPWRGTGPGFWPRRRGTPPARRRTWSRSRSRSGNVYVRDVERADCIRRHNFHSNILSISYLYYY